ncbi:MAG TPA: hypothetical protein VIU39_09420, partial [Anaerolineales bacterium]
MGTPANAETFPEALFEIMKRLNPALQELEPYEFRYCLNNLAPAEGWGSILPATEQLIEACVTSREFYDSIQIKPRVEDRIVLDKRIVHLTNMLFAGLVSGAYDPAWVDRHFYFDVRGFFFLHRTAYFTDAIREHLGGKP